jgi:hypothetical protein
LVSIYFSRCEKNWVTEEAEIGFCLSEDGDQHDAPCSCTSMCCITHGIIEWRKWCKRGWQALGQWHQI